MNREDGQTTDVYENADDIKGRDCMRIISSRAALVCLVLLCVLLLTAVIVLGVMFTLERSQTSNTTEERIQLLTKITNLTQLNAQLNQERTELSKNLGERGKCEVYIETKQPNGWIYYKCNLYFLSSEKKSWTESRRYCTDRGADLIIINNREEQDFAFWKVSAGVGLVWIGLTDSDLEGRWKWVDGSTLTSGFWAGAEPSGQTRENCAVSHASGWDDYPCNDIFNFICEKRILK